ncbi:MAG: adenosylhomocysteinase [Bryobacteraceae bacterium]|nr:adenosylhomocysteinase [Bryobacteraceae bacterium]
MERVATAPAVPCDIRDLALADAGRRRIEWASLTMPVIRTIRKQFIRSQPFAGIRIAASLPVTAETANLMITLRDGGAVPFLSGSNSLSTQDDVAASLVRDFQIPVFAIRDSSPELSESHLAAALQSKPHITMDSEAAFGRLLLTRFQDHVPGLIGCTEETGSGASRFRTMVRTGTLAFPVIAADEAPTKSFFDGRYGTGQSTFDNVIRLTGILVAGMNVVVAGYGGCGQAIAARARGLGANVIVTETDPARALEAAMDGYRVAPMAEAAPLGQLFITVTGNRNVLAREMFERIRDGAVLCNAGHSNVEIDVPGLARAAGSRGETREGVEEFKMRDGRRIYLLAEGRLMGLASGDGHAASVMDISFATQALSAEYLLKNQSSLDKLVYSVPEGIDKRVARIKLDSMGVAIDKLTIEQEQYLASCEGS